MTVQATDDDVTSLRHRGAGWAPKSPCCIACRVGGGCEAANFPALWQRGAHDRQSCHSAMLPARKTKISAMTRILMSQHAVTWFPFLVASADLAPRILRCLSPVTPAGRGGGRRHGDEGQGAVARDGGGAACTGGGGKGGTTMYAVRPSMASGKLAGGSDAGGRGGRSSAPSRTLPPGPVS